MSIGEWNSVSIVGRGRVCGNRPTEEGIEKIYPLVWIMPIMNESSLNCFMSEEVANRIPLIVVVSWL